MDADKIKLIIMNIEMLLLELKNELKGSLNNNYVEKGGPEYSSLPFSDYDEVFNE